MIHHPPRPPSDVGDLAPGWRAGTVLAVSRVSPSAGLSAMTTLEMANVKQWCMHTSAGHRVHRLAPMQTDDCSQGSIGPRTERSRPPEREWSCPFSRIFDVHWGGEKCPPTWKSWCPPTHRRAHRSPLRACAFRSHSHEKLDVAVCDPLPVSRTQREHRRRPHEKLPTAIGWPLRCASSTRRSCRCRKSLLVETEA